VQVAVKNYLMDPTTNSPSYNLIGDLSLLGKSHLDSNPPINTYVEVLLPSGNLKILKSRILGYMGGGGGGGIDFSIEESSHTSSGVGIGGPSNLSLYFHVWVPLHLNTWREILCLCSLFQFLLGE
jgi:hypothetical protein